MGETNVGHAAGNQYVDGDGDLHLNGSNMFVEDASLISYRGAGTGTGDKIMRIGGSTTEGMEYVVYEVSAVPAAVETDFLLVPANSRIESVQVNLDAAVTGGGTTVAVSIGTTADPDKYGTVATLTLDSKINYLGDGSVLTSAEQIAVNGTVSGGATAGDTALTVGTIRVVVRYWTLNALDNA